MIQPDPNFDDSPLLLWGLDVDSGTVDHQSADGFPSAGSLEAVSDASAPAVFGFCQQALVDPITFSSPGSYVLSGFVQSVGEMGIGAPQATLSFYSPGTSEVATCPEEDLTASLTVDLPISVDAWAPFEMTIDIPEIAHDFRLEFTSGHSLSGATTIRLDTLALVPTSIFSDGFESDSTDNWSPQ